VSAPPIAVVGAGSFGIGLARAAGRVRGNVVLWSRRARDLGDGNQIRTTTDLAEIREAELVFLAVSSIRLPEVASELGKHLDGAHMLVHVSRGLAGDGLRPLSRLLRDLTPCRRVGALAGPLVATALADATPSGGVVGSRFPEVIEAVRQAIAGSSLRIYGTDDVLGVEIASALVGVIALAVGYAQGLGLGPAALAVLTTRGISEAARVGTSLGAAERTFSGLAGFGDLIAAVAGDERPETKLGRAVARGATLEEARREAGANIEGVTLARRICTYARRIGLEAPIAETIADLIDGRVGAEAAISGLMARQVWIE